MKEDKFKLFGGFDLRRTDRQTDGRTFVFVELLSRLKKLKNLWISVILQMHWDEIVRKSTIIKLIYGQIWDRRKYYCL